MPGPFDSSQGYTYWGDPGAGGVKSGNYTPTPPLQNPNFPQGLTPNGPPQNTQEIPRGVPPGAPGYLDMNMLMQWLPQLQALMGGAQNDRQGFMDMLSRLSGQDYERGAFQLNRAEDMYGQGGAMDDYLMNLYGQVLGVGFDKTPGIPSHEWIPTGPGGYYGNDTPGTPTPPINGPGNTPAPPGFPINPNGIHSGPTPPAGGDVTEKMMNPDPNLEILGGGGFGGDPGILNPDGSYTPGNVPGSPNGPGGPQPPGGTPPAGGGGQGTWHPYGPGEGQGHWLDQIKGSQYGWHQLPGGFDPNNHTTWGLLAPQAQSISNDLNSQEKAYRDWGVRGGQLDASEAGAIDKAYSQKAGLKQDLLKQALSYVQNSAAQKMFGVSAGENSGAAGQGFGGLNSYLSGLTSANQGVFGSGLNYDLGMRGQDLQNSQFQQNMNWLQSQQGQQFWQSLMGAGGGGLFGLLHWMFPGGVGIGGSPGPLGHGDNVNGVAWGNGNNPAVTPAGSGAGVY